MTTATATYRGLESPITRIPGRAAEIACGAAVGLGRGAEAVVPGLVAGAVEALQVTEKGSSEDSFRTCEGYYLATLAQDVALGMAIGAAVAGPLGVVGGACTGLVVAFLHGVRASDPAEERIVDDVCGAVRRGLPPGSSRPAAVLRGALAGAAQAALTATGLGFAQAAGTARGLREVLLGALFDSPPAEEEGDPGAAGSVRYGLGLLGGFLGTLECAEKDHDPFETYRHAVHQAFAEGARRRDHPQLQEE